MAEGEALCKTKKELEKWETLRMDSVEEAVLYGITETQRERKS